MFICDSKKFFILITAIFFLISHFHKIIQFMPMDDDIFRI